MGGSGGGGYAGGGYSGGGGGGDKCRISLGASLSSPDPEAIASIQTGNILDVIVDQSSGTPVVQVLNPSGTPAGSLAGIPHLSTLIDCIEGGESYVFVVSTISGSRVEGRLRNA